MITHNIAITTETRENMRGGEGKVELGHWFVSENFGGKVRLCARLTLPPGASIGSHAHEGEDEIYVVMSGNGKIFEDGEWITISPGDAILTGKGDSHSVKNDGTEPLVIAAVIIQY